jgi:hypothetical protein
MPKEHRKAIAGTFGAVRARQSLTACAGRCQSIWTGEACDEQLRQARSGNDSVAQWPRVTLAGALGWNAARIDLADFLSLLLRQLQHTALSLQLPQHCSTTGKAGNDHYTAEYQRQ